MGCKKKKNRVNYKMPTLIVDNKERSIIKELDKRRAKFKVEQLSTDFIIQGKDLEKNIISIGAERKTQNDFLNSIIDKRIINQLIFLKDNFSIPLLIVEGEENMYELRNFHPNAIRGMFASIALDFQIPILYTKNHKDTTALLITILKRLEKPKKHISLLKKRKPLTLKEQQEYIIESLPSIGPTLSRSLLKKFKTVKKVINAKEKQLEKINKIGPKKIKKIQEVINKNYKE